VTAADNDGAARARIEEIRRSLTTTTEAGARSRLRVRLADVLSALGEVDLAAGELRQAAAEAPPSAGLMFAVRALAPRLPATQAAALRVAARAGRPAAASTPARTRSRRPSIGEAPLGAPMPAPAPLPAIARETSSRDLRSGVPADPLEAAFAALKERKPTRARRLGEEAARAGGADRARELTALVDALERAGAGRQSLLLARTLAESPPRPSSARAGADPAAAKLAAVIDRAVESGERTLAMRWRADLPPSMRVPEPIVPRSQDAGAQSPPMQFRAAQRAVLATASGGNIEAAIIRLFPSLDGHPGRAAALALGERLVGGLGERAAETRAELLRLAFQGERTPRRRQTLALRWAETLRRSGDNAGAIAALERAIGELPPDQSPALRRARAELLRAAGRSAELTRALDRDAEVESGAARTALRSEQARLLDGLGETDGALEVRLQALHDAPGDLGLLVPARQRLEGVGRLDRSLELAAAAIPHLADRTARAALLRDVATLAEASAGDRPRAATAWLEVLALNPDDTAARDAAERLLQQTGDRTRLGALLAVAASRESEPDARAAIQWRLAEFRRVAEDAPQAALALYREIVNVRGKPSGAAPYADDDWQRRDDVLALHTARALAAPTIEARALAIADRASALIDAGRLDEADRDLGRALDNVPPGAEIVHVLERLYEKRADWRGLKHRLHARTDRATGTGAAWLWYGIGRANERLGDADAERAAYERALAADGTLRPVVTVLRRLAVARADFEEAARLLEREIELCASPSERVTLLTELGVLQTGRLGRPARAIEVLDAALAYEPGNVGALDALFGAALGAGSWEKAAQALEALLAGSTTIGDAAQRYHQVGMAAEKAGQLDRALGLYSRSYARNPAYRPTLERLSEICFERQQWDNTWKATEHLLERHGADLDAQTRASLMLRSAIADLHVGQRLAASAMVARMVAGPSSSSGVRDVADSWASMRFERRLLVGVEGDRRARILARLADVMTLTEAVPRHPARVMTREILAALAVVDGRWADALMLLDGLGADQALDASRRCLFLVAAGDVLLHQQGDMAGAALRYQRARALNPAEPRLGRAGIVQMTDGLL